MFTVRIDGQVNIFEAEQLKETPFLDLRDRISASGEAGLFSMAFDPNFSTNGHMYVYFVQVGGPLLVERYTVGGNPNQAERSSARSLLAMRHGDHHFGGTIQFGPDGYLYLAPGDGGEGHLSQDLSSTRGKILRIDVANDGSYTIPTTNPFMGSDGARGEIWATGLRNPWRWTIDHVSGLMYVADVGQNAWEEVNVVPLGNGGVNLGWPRMEGTECYPRTSSPCDSAGLTQPMIAYSHTDPTAHPSGCSVTGGYVYRGQAIPGLQGHYLYSDFCGGWLRSFRMEGGVPRDLNGWTVPGLRQAVSFGEDGRGELYVLTAAGDVFRVVQHEKLLD